MSDQGNPNAAEARRVVLDARARLITSRERIARGKASLLKSMTRLFQSELCLSAVDSLSAAAARPYATDTSGATDGHSARARGFTRARADSLTGSPPG
jgi:hypothetical protein